MPADAGQPNIVSDTTTARRAGAPADAAPRAGATLRQRRSSARNGTGVSSASVELELTSVPRRSQSRAVARLTVAWLLFGAFGLISLLAGTTSDPRTGELIASNLIAPMYLLTVGALFWAAIETRCATVVRRQRQRS